MSDKKVLLIAGTRPEAIKLVPLYLHLKRNTQLTPLFCNTGQHKEMLEQVTDFFGVSPEFNLRVMERSKTLCDIAAHILADIQHIYAQEKPAIAVVQGDTTTALAGGLAAHYCGIPLAHVEAGLRTYDLSAPFPEEANRQCLSRLASLHFAPTEQAKNNLLAERIPPDSIYVTGNTVIDALFHAQKRLSSYATPLSDSIGDAPVVLVTLHRRENHKSLSDICARLIQLAHAYPELRFIFPVHRNPIVREAVKALESHGSFLLLEPLPYPEFIHWMLRADILCSDSGGVQEEAPALGKQVLLLRDTTERPEVVESGHVHIVGGNGEGLLSAFEKIVKQKRNGFLMEPCHIFGDGNASAHITGIIEKRLQQSAFRH